VRSWLITHAPASLTSCAPSLTPASHTHTCAPVGSAMTAIRPAGGASNGSTRIVPPAARAAAAASSALSTRTCIVKLGAIGWPPGGSEPMPATSRPRSCATKYRPGGSPGMSPGPANSHPKTPL
jgi:hypothetical protein